MDDTTPIGERLGSERLYDQTGREPEPLISPETTLPPVGRGNLFAVAGEAQGAAVPPPKAAKTPRPAKAAKPTPIPVPDKPGSSRWAEANWRAIISSVLELVGIAAITAGCAMIAPYVGFIVGGILLVLLGVASGWDVTK